MMKFSLQEQMRILVTLIIYTSDIIFILKIALLHAKMWLWMRIYRISGVISYTSKTSQ